MNLDSGATFKFMLAGGALFCAALGAQSLNFDQAGVQQSADDSPSPPASALSELNGSYYSSKENCGGPPEITIANDVFDARVEGLTWPKLKYDSSGFFAVERSDPLAPEAIKNFVVAASPRPDGSTIVSIFMPLTDADLEYAGLSDDLDRPSDGIKVLAYAAYSVEGSVDLSQVQPAFPEPQDATILLACIE